MTTIEFNTHMLSFSEKLKYFALSLTSDKDDADDLFQETYLKAFSYKERISDYNNLKAWIYTIMKNTFINQYRRTYKSSTRIQNSDNPYEIENSSKKYVVAPDVELSVKEIKAVIDHLDDEYRIPFQMYLDGFKYKEIADEADLHMGTVKSRIFHARQKLMNSLSDYRA
ncbi:RNA polymerase sigma factor [Bacteroidota bacterium]